MSSQGPQNHQYNNPTSGGTVNAYQGTGNQIFNTTVQQAAQRRRRFTAKLVLGFLVADVVYFFYGMWSYTGQNTPGDTWRAGIYLVMLVVTVRLIRRWFRDRL